MRRTTYAILGTSFTPPGQLPEGLSVQEVECEVIDLAVLRSVAETSTLSVREDPTARGRVLLELEMDEGAHDGVGSGLFDDEALRQLRDALIVRLGDGRPRRVLMKSAPHPTQWRWFETAPDRFTYGRSWPEARAEAGVEGEGDTINWSVEQIRFDDPDVVLIDVTHEHPEVNA